MADSAPSLSDAFRRRTGLALFIVVALGLASYVAQLLLLNPAIEDGGVINLAGRQRMLSQRIALHVSMLGQSRLTTDERREREASLERDLTEMHTALAHLAPSADDSYLDGALRRHYFAEPYALSRRTDAYLGIARSALEESRAQDAVASTTLSKTTRHAAELLPRLQTAVALFEAANVKHLTTLHRALGLVFLAQLVAVLLMWRFVLRPTALHLSTRETAQRTADEERDRREAEDRFVTKLQHGMENVDAPKDIMNLAQLAFREVASADSIELLLADSSEAHLRRAAASHPAEQGCSVETPFECPAVRNGRTSVFSSSAGLDTCPRLAEVEERCSALCVPVNFMGRSLGVLRATGPEHSPPDRRRLRVLGGAIGSRLGSIRAFNQVQLQASTDALTGLLNRRAVEQKVRRLRQASKRYAVSMLDLDKFKSLNDTYGHETGDRALTTFAKCLRETIGERGIVGRFGGEEFIVVFPDADRRQATEYLDEVRVHLARVLVSGDVPTYTVSGGASDTSLSTDFNELVSMADAALYRAKRAGRDRIVTHDDVVAEAPPVILSHPPQRAAE